MAKLDAGECTILGTALGKGMSGDPQQAQYEDAMERNRQLRAELRTLYREHHRLRERLRTLTAENAAVSGASRRQRELSQASLRVRKKAL